MKTEAASTNDMAITAIDVGDDGNYGDSVVLTTGGKTLVMDTSCEYRSGHVIGWLKNNRRSHIDLYISHYHDDHVWSMATILKDSYFTVGTIYLPNDTYLKKGYGKNPSYMKLHLNMYNEIVKLAKQKGIKLVYLGKGSSFSYGNAKLEVLWGPGFDKDARYGTNYVNNNSMVTRVSCGGVRYLTCGDLEAAAESEVLSSGVDLQADIYKASHHGASGSNSAAFVAKVQPSWSFWNCTDETSASLGTVGWISGTYSRLRQYGNCLGVGYNGTITFSVRDGKIRVSGQRNMATQTFTVGNQTVKLQRSAGCPWRLTDRIKEMEFAGGTWVQDSTGWRFQYADGEFAQDAVVYSGGQGYYIDSDGYMIRDWYTAEDGSTYLAQSNGALVAGWKKMQGKWYYFDVSTYKMTTGWLKLDNTWYYMNEEGVMTTGWQKVEDHWYYMSGSGAMMTGWQKSGGNWYYLAASGVMTTGWQKIGGNWYYMNESGAMTTGWQKVREHWYHMNSSGVMEKGRKTIGGLPYDLGTDGALRAGWISSGKKWYHVDADGKHGSGRRQISGKWYYFDASTRVMKNSGWFKADGKWYYANSNGELKNGWMKEKNNWYYFKDNAAAANCVLLINGKRYGFRPSCAMYGKGWLMVDGKWYYAESSGELKNGWMSLNEKTYYFGEDAACVVGRVQIEDAYYFFDRKSCAQVKSGWIEDEYEVEDENGVKTVVQETLYACETKEEAEKIGVYEEEAEKIEVYEEEADSDRTIHEFIPGQLAVGRAEIDGNIYYFNEEGVLLKNVKIDGGFADEKGIWKDGEKEPVQEVSEETLENSSNQSTEKAAEEDPEKTSKEDVEAPSSSGKELKDAQDSAEESTTTTENESDDANVRDDSQDEGTKIADDSAQEMDESRN